MTRKAFIADVAAATERNIPGVVNVSRGDDDGEVNFDYAPVSGDRLEITVLVTGILSPSAMPFIHV